MEFHLVYCCVIKPSCCRICSLEQSIAWWLEPELGLESTTWRRTRKKKRKKNLISTLYHRCLHQMVRDIIVYYKTLINLLWNHIMSMGGGVETSDFHRYDNRRIIILFNSLLCSHPTQGYAKLPIWEVLCMKLGTSNVIFITWIKRIWAIFKSTKCSCS